MKLKKDLPLFIFVMSFTTACEQDIIEPIIDNNTITDETETTTTYSFTIVDTGVTKFYNNNAEISSPIAEQAFYGQDAHF